MLATESSAIATDRPASVLELALERLRYHPYLPLRNVLCEYEDGTLTLRGWLPTYYLKQRAQEAVAGIEGIRRIDNRIVVTAGVQ